MNKHEAKVIKCLKDPNCAIDDALFRYLDSFPEMDWIGLADEGRRITNLMADADPYSVEAMGEYDVSDHVLSAVAAASWGNACNFIARWMGLDQDAFETFVIERAQSEHSETPSTPERFVELVKQCDVWLKALKASKDENEKLPEWSLV